MKIVNLGINYLLAVLCLSLLLEEGAHGYNIQQHLTKKMKSTEMDKFLAPTDDIIDNDEE